MIEEEKDPQEERIEVGKARYRIYLIMNIFINVIR